MTILMQKRRLARTDKIVNNMFKMLNCNSKTRIGAVRNPESGMLTNSENELLGVFRENYRQKTTDTFISDETTQLQCSDLDELLIQHPEYNIDDFFYDPFNLTKLDATDILFSHKELSAAINELKKTSSPGSSGTDKSVLQFMLKFFPNITRRYFNALILDTEWEKSSTTQFLKARKVILIPKPGKDKLDPNSYRPISLLEVPYKIVSKRYSQFLQRSLNKLISPNQFGFTPGRSMNLASFSLLGTIERLSHIQKGDHMVAFLDMKAAFDCARHPCTNFLIGKIFPKGNFNSSFAKLCANGAAIIAVNSACADPLILSRGSGQGDPASSTRFLVSHMFWSSFLIEQLRIGSLKSLSIELSEIRPSHYSPPPSSYPEVRQIVREVAFADDTSICIRCPTKINEIDTFWNVLGKLENVTGLSINKDKSEIIPLFRVNNHQKELITKLGAISKSVKHLGIRISDSSAESARLTFEEGLVKLKAASEKVTRFPGKDLLAKAQICNSICASIFQHRISVFFPDENVSKKIDKKIRDSLWTTQFEGSLSGRPKISRENVTKPPSKGGVNLASIESRSKAAVLKALVDIFKHAWNFKDSILNALLGDVMSNNLNLELMSLNKLRCKHILKKFELFFPNYVTIHNEVLPVLEFFETDPNLWYRSPLFRNSYAINKNSFFNPLSRTSFNSETSSRPDQQFPTLASLFNFKKSPLTKRTFHHPLENHPAIPPSPPQH